MNGLVCGIVNGFLRVVNSMKGLRNARLRLCMFLCLYIILFLLVPFFINDKYISTNPSFGSSLEGNRSLNCSLNCSLNRSLNYLFLEVK